jgi:hypothetical protein
LSRSNQIRTDALDGLQLGLDDLLHQEVPLRVARRRQHLEERQRHRRCVLAPGEVAVDACGPAQASALQSVAHLRRGEFGAEAFVELHRHERAPAVGFAAKLPDPGDRAQQLLERLDDLVLDFLRRHRALAERDVDVDLVAGQAAGCEPQRQLGERDHADQQDRAGHHQGQHRPRDEQRDQAASLRRGQLCERVVQHQVRRSLSE